MTEMSCGDNDPYKQENAVDGKQPPNAPPPGEMTLGHTFLVVFKWVILLLFSLLIKTACEGIVLRATGKTTQFSQPTVLPFMLGNPDNLLSAFFHPHWAYLLGVMQMLVTLLFAMRYFICLVDPLERLARLDPERKLSQVEIREGLSRVQTHAFVYVLFVTLIEFILLFHAASSLADFYQWLYFLLWLVVCDSVFFLVILRYSYLVIELPKSYDIMKHGIRKLLDILKAVGVIIRNLAKGNIKGVIKVATDYIEKSKQLDQEHGEKQAQFKTVQDRLKEIGKEYGTWNLLDAGILMLGLLPVYLNKNHFPFLFPDSVGDTVECIFVIACVVFVTLLMYSSVRAAKFAHPRLLALVTSALMIVVAILIFAQDQFGVFSSPEIPEFVYGAILCFGTCCFSYFNYHSQRPLWHLHMRLLWLS